MNPEAYQYEKNNFRYDMNENDGMGKENMYSHPSIMVTSFHKEKYKDFNNYVDNSNLADTEKTQSIGCLIYKSIFRNKDNTPLNKYIKNNNTNNYINNSYSQNNKMTSSTPNKNNSGYNKNYLGKEMNNRNQNFHNTINDYNCLKNTNINVIKIDDKMQNIDLSNNLTNNINNKNKKDNIQINYLPESYNLPIENNKILNNLNFSVNNNSNNNEFNGILSPVGSSNKKRDYDKQNLLNKNNKPIEYFSSKNNTTVQNKKNNSIKENLQITSTEKSYGSKNNASIFKNSELLDLHSNDYREEIINNDFCDLDKNYFLNNVKEIQDLDFIDECNGMKSEINDVYNRSNTANLNNNTSNIFNNSNIRETNISKDQLENINNFDQKHKNNNSSNNVIEHCSFTGRGNNIINNNTTIKSANMNVISKGNKINDKKIQNYSSNNTNVVNRRDYNNSKNKNYLQKSYNSNKNFKHNNKILNKNSYGNNKKNNEYINLINASKENIQNKKNSNKNLRSKEQLENYPIMNNLQNYYSTLSNENNLKNLTGFNKLGNSIGPTNSNLNKPTNINLLNQSDFMLSQGKSSINSTNYIDGSNNITNNSNGGLSDDYNNLFNHYLKLLKTNEKLEEELKYKNNYIKELQIKNKESYDKINNFINIKKRLTEELKKTEEAYKNKIKSLQNNNFLLDKENWELKNMEGGYNKYQKKIKELQEEVEKYKVENNKLKIIIIQNKNNFKKNNNKAKMRLSSSYNGASHNFDDDSEEKTRNRFYSSNHDINERKSGFSSNSVSKGKRPCLHFNKSFKEDYDEQNILKKSYIEEEGSKKNMNVVHL